MPHPLRTRRTAAVLTVLTVAVVLGPFLVVQGVGQAHVVPDPVRVPDRPVALVLGAGLTSAGTPSPYLRRRLDAAVDLYERGVVQAVLVSGDRSGPHYDEPGAMRDHLIAHGVPSGAILQDDAGVDTHASCVRAHDLFDVDAAVVVTQDYHLRRALFSCRAAGVDAVGVGVSAQSVRPVRAAWWHVREVPAAAKAVLDALTG
ncbi:SanA/YdcF family protein [Cellulomonas phragmiteti]|uniref:DUF218 domain-containing protein n=1 Tax=Cellulomonas phragmiteti TaxID=478780 RepID=A0ABQ4DNZ2_9CELL|nr:ElyC/SanA/YdcF family protein [Cellulomonas phragmiteti]GIG41075.1 hypothetical protein Cph01nite_28370 [Cellulomonas phragmiteti]